MRRAYRTLTRCLVCGFTEVRTDEVVERGLVLLAECPRCQHRWTTRDPLAEGLLGRARRAGRAEIPPAAAAA